MVLINGELIRCRFDATCRGPRGGSRTCRQWPFGGAGGLMVSGQQRFLTLGTSTDTYGTDLPIVDNRFVDHRHRMWRHFGIRGGRCRCRIIRHRCSQQRRHRIVAGVTAWVHHCEQLRATTRMYTTKQVTISSRNHTYHNLQRLNNGPLIDGRALYQSWYHYQHRHGPGALAIILLPIVAISQHTNTVGHITDKRIYDLKNTMIHTTL